MAHIVLRAAALLHLAIQLFIFLPVHWQREDIHRDTLYLYTAAERVRTGEALYWPWPEYGPHVHTPQGPLYPPERHPYPPFLATVLAPFTQVPFATFARFWYLPLLAAFWVYAWCLARLVRPGRTGVWDVLTAGAVLSIFPGTTRAISLGQIDPILWAAFGVALAVPALRGACFAGSAAVKLYAGWPLLFAIRREGARVLLPALGLGAVLFIMSGVVLGFGAYVDWARYMLPVIGQASFNPDNVSLSFAGLRLARVLGWEYVPGPLPAAARIYLLVIGVAAPLATGLALRRARPLVQYAWVGAAAVLFAPLCWSTYLPLLLVPLAVTIAPEHTKGPGRMPGAPGDRQYRSRRPPPPPPP